MNNLNANFDKPVILAVDDKPELLTVIVNMLKDHYKVMAATSGAAALKVIEKYKPQLFLLDIEMPQMSGFQLAQAIRSYDEFKLTPIIFLTGKVSRDDVVSAIKNGGNDYIVKPAEKDVLLGKIQKYL